MKRLLLIALMAGGLAFVPAQRSDAQVSIGIGGVGVGFGYPAIGIAITTIRTDMAITRMDTTDRIDTMAIPRARSYYRYRASGLPPPPESSLLSLLSDVREQIQRSWLGRDFEPALFLAN